LDDRISAPAGWKSALLFLAVGVGIVVLASAAGYGVAMAFDGWSGIDEARAFAAGETEALLTSRISMALFAFQLVTVLLVFAANAAMRRGGEPFLRFRMPEGGIRTLFLATAALITFATLYGALVYSFDKNAFRQDLGPFAEMMKSRTWWLVLIAAGIGAPVAEECLFRGLLFGGLKQTPVGVTGAAGITAVMWAALHANYSVYGLVAISLIGLYLAFLRERTGTLLTSIVCHGTYNSLIVLILAFSPNDLIVTG
jgi:hypothetical protein